MTKYLLSIILILVMWVFYIIYKEFAKWEENIITRVEEDPGLEQLLSEYISEDNFREELEAGLSKEMFIVYCRVKLINRLNDDIDNRKFNSYITVNKLGVSTFRTAAEKYINYSEKITSELELIFIENISRNVELAAMFEEEYNESLKEFGEDPDKDLELHPTVQEIHEPETEEIDEITLADISSTGTVEDI